MYRSRSKRPKGRKTQWLLTLALPLALCMWLLIAAETNLAPIVMKIAEVRAESWAIQTISRVVMEEIIPGIDYNNLIQLEKDTRGRVAFMQPNTLEINRVMSRAVVAIQDELRQSEEFKVMVPLNQALGTELFMNVGPRVPATVTAVGTVEGSVSEEFAEAGINQTKHVIYLEIKAYMYIVVPFVRSTREVSTRLALAQAIIVGDVPGTYVRIGH